MGRTGARPTTGGFGGFTPNPSIPYPGGRVVTSDVTQAMDTLNFGGTTTAQPTVPAPSATPSATPAATPQPTAAPPDRMDPSGAGFASRELQPRVWSIRDRAGYVAPTTDNADAEIAAGATLNPPTATGVPSGGGRPPGITSDPNEDWTGRGEPTVDVNWDAGNRSAPYWEQPVTPRYNPGGRDIANFGGNMTLGQFLNTPLSTMLYATNRWQPPVGGGDIRYAGTTAHTPAEAGAQELAPPTSDAEARGAAETARLKATGELNPDGTTGTTNATAPPPSGGGGDTRNTALSPAAYAQATFGGVTPTGYRDPAGSAATDPHAAGALMAWFQSMGGNTNDTGTTGDAGHTIYYPNVGTPMGRADEESGTVVRSEQTFGRPTAESIASQNLYRQAIAAVPMGRDGFTLPYVQKLNDWIAAQKRKGSG